MKHSVAGVAPDLLAPVYLDRFVALFGVAARKSLIQWTRASTGEAQLAFLDASSKGDVVPASTPCVIYIGKTSAATEKARNARWVSHLPAEFTVSDLIDAREEAGEVLVEAVAGQDFDLLAGETAPGGGFVETSGLSLYGDAFHNRILGIKKSRSLQNGILRVFTLSYHTANCI